MIDPLAQFFNRPPPENLLKLFSLTKKAEVKKYAAGLTVRSDDLTRMILGAGRAGFIHVPRFGESQPDDLQLSSRELDSFRGMPDGTETDRLRGKAMRKIVQMFAVRKLSAFHFFSAPAGVAPDYVHPARFPCEEGKSLAAWDAHPFHKSSMDGNRPFRYMEFIPRSPQWSSYQILR